MTYALENEKEAHRLETQSGLPGYQLARELEGIRIDTGSRVLDAGCGTGLGARYLTERFPGIQAEGCDASALRLKEAEKLRSRPEHQSIRFFECDLSRIASEENRYDFILCRYVFEHLAQHQEIADELARVLKPGGTLCVVNFDGILFNLGHSNPKLAGFLNTLEERLPYDLYVGRKIPAFLTRAGLEVSWRVDAISFQGQALEEELSQTRQRLSFAQPVLQKALGGERPAEEFVAAYCEEMTRPGNSLFYNKFVVQGRKPDVSRKPRLIASRD